MNTPMFLKYFGWVFLSIAILTSCTKDDSQPDDDEGPSITMNVGIEGGSITFNDITVDIPDRAFDTPQDIKLTELLVESEAFEDIVSRSYRIEGLPLQTREDISITLLFEDLEGDENILLEYEAWKKGLNRGGLTHMFLPSSESGGRLVGSIPAYDALSGLKDDGISTRDQRHWFDIFALGRYTETTSNAKHFLIHTPTVDIDAAIDLAEYLEEAYNQFKDMGFDYSKRTDWPVEVTIKKLKEGEFGAFCSSIRGKNAATIEINTTTLDSEENLRVTAGHEFFHLVQDWYDNRSAWQKCKDEYEGGPPQLWLDEAMSVWSEKYFTTQQRFAPALFVQNLPLILEGGYQAYGTKSQKQEYGYGLAGFIEFIHSNYGGNATLIDIYEDYEKNKEAMSAVDRVFLSSIGARWPFFIRDLMEFKLFPSVEGSLYSPELLLQGLAQSRTLKAEQPIASEVFDFSLPDLSAKAFMIRNRTFTGFDPNAVLTFDVLNNEDAVIQVYRTHRDKKTSEMIAEGTDIVTISDFTDHILEGYVIGALVINTDDDRPFDGSENVSMKISIAQPISFEEVETQLTINGIFDFEEKDELWGVDTNYTKDTWQIGSPILALANGIDYVTTISGSTYTTTLSGTNTSYFDLVDGTMTSTFDDPADPTQLDELHFYANAIRSDTIGGFGKVTTSQVKYIMREIALDRFDSFCNCYIFSSDLTKQQIEMAEYSSETIHYINGVVDPRKYKKESLRSYESGRGVTTYYK